ncbi:MAG: hypothetical protein Q8Q10_03735 [bacterium]|nr:hypothetical protein [bacterium]
MAYKRYSIAIIPPADIVERAIEMSQALQQFDSFFVLDGKTLHPHISLYRVPFEQAALVSVIKALEKIAADTKPFLLRQDTYYPDQGVWVGVRYIADKAILDLHTGVIETTKEYRAEQDDVRYAARWPELSHSQRKNIQDCGWSDAFTLYSPHISFTKLKQPKADVLVHLPHRDFSFLAEHVGLYELGKNATCVELVADFRLAG